MYKYPKVWTSDCVIAHKLTDRIRSNSHRNGGEEQFGELFQVKHNGGYRGSLS